MSDGRIYTATAERDGRFWYLEVKELDAATQARRLDQAEEMVRDLISIKLDVPVDSFDVIVVPKIADHVDELVTVAKTAAVKARQAQEAASSLQREAALALTQLGLTTRDVGDLLGLSHQRVAQLLDMPEWVRETLLGRRAASKVDAAGIAVTTEG